MVVGRRKEEELADGLTAVPLLLPIQPHLPADTARGAPGPEQQHLLTTASSSSSSSLESSASTADKPSSRTQPQAPGTGKAGCAGEARASSRSSGKRRAPSWLHLPFVCLPDFCLSHLLLDLPCRLRPELLAGPSKPCLTGLGSPSSLTPPTALRCNTA